MEILPFYNGYITANLAVADIALFNVEVAQF